MNDLTFEIFAGYFSIGLCAGLIVSFAGWVTRRIIITATKFF